VTEAQLATRDRSRRLEPARDYFDYFDYFAA